LYLDWAGAIQRLYPRVIHLPCNVATHWLWVIHRIGDNSVGLLCIPPHTPRSA